MQPLICWVFLGDTPGLLGVRAHRDIIPFFLVSKANLRARILVTSVGEDGGESPKEQRWSSSRATVGKVRYSQEDSGMGMF